MKLKELTAEKWEFWEEKVEKQSQGYYIYYLGIPYPVRGYKDRRNDPNHNLRALDALGVVKKFLYSLTFLLKVVVPRTISVKKWNGFLRNIYLTCWWQLNPYFLEDNEWTVPVWEIGKLINSFLSKLGFDKEVSEGWAKVIMCFLEFDTAYRYRLQDILVYIGGGVGKMLEIYAQREEMLGAKARIEKIVKILKYILWIPKFKKAFQEAIDSIDLEKIKLDNNDKFHFAWWKGYNYEGKSFEERFSPYEKIYKEAPFRKRENPQVTANFMTGN